MIGRKLEIKQLNDLLDSKKSEFIAITGRRRVGKTYLIDTVFEKQICFRVSGIQDVGLNHQLFNFMQKLSEYSTINFQETNNWQAAFLALKQYCQKLKKKNKKVLFFDELPWMNTPKSNFIQFLAHFWNDYLSKENDFILVICGSASSWITKKIINDKGGLHNRLTEIIRLKPFTLSETKIFLASNKINFSNQSIALLYMVFGGIPYYLNLIKRGDSIHTAIDRLCFEEGGMMKNEYNNLYKALFYNASDHEAIVEALAQSKNGKDRKTILAASKVKTGGPYNRAMEDLILSGFVSEEAFYGNKKRDSLYKLNDEYSAFYHRFIKPIRKKTQFNWHQIAASQAFKIWSGYAFEVLCVKHIDKIKAKLGISSVLTEIYSFELKGNENSEGFQIDLIIDRKDDTIHLCEIKFYAGPFVIDKSYAKELIHRKQKFIEYTKTKKQVLTTFITNHELKTNDYSKELVDAQIILDDLF